MRRAALAFVVSFLAASGATAARADCAGEAAAMRQRLSTITDEAQRRELTLLLDKAESDAKAGRERDCVDALVRARALLH